MPPELTVADWLQASYTIMTASMSLGAKIYPFIFAINCLRAIGNAI